MRASDRICVSWSHASSRQGDSLTCGGFSLRKGNLALYGLIYAPGSAAPLEKLGKHKTGAGCLYINKLADVNADVLKDLVRIGYTHMTTVLLQSLPSQR